MDSKDDISRKHFIDNSWAYQSIKLHRRILLLETKMPRIKSEIGNGIVLSSVCSTLLFDPSSFKDPSAIKKTGMVSIGITLTYTIYKLYTLWSCRNDIEEGHKMQKRMPRYPKPSCYYELHDRCSESNEFLQKTNKY